MDEKHEAQQRKIEELLSEFSTHRDSIKEMIKELEDIRGKVDKILPDSLDNRYVRLFEEKIKSITSFFNSLLEMRKEIAKSVKDEIEIRRKLKDKPLETDVEQLLDIRSMVKKIDKFRSETEKLKEKRESKEQTIDESIVIPGINDGKGEN